MNIDLLNSLKASLLEIENGHIKEISDPLLRGFSGSKLQALLSKFTRTLCSSDEIYLEIGVFQGLTLISNAVSNLGTNCYGIDNFSLFNEGLVNHQIVMDKIAQKNLDNVKIINMDYEEALKDLPSKVSNKKIGVYFIDGPHDYRSQLMALLLAKPYLAKNCAVIVDDANYPHVRQATVDFLRVNPEFALLFEAYTPIHIANMNEIQKIDVINGWWNGVHVLVHDPDNIISRGYPREENKHLYFASHEVFRHEFAELANSTLCTIQKFVDGLYQDENEVLLQLKFEFLEHRRLHPKRFNHQNTYSEDLPQFYIHL